MHRKRTDDRTTWQYRVYTYGATLHDLSPPQRWPAPLRAVVLAQRDLWNACVAAWTVNRQQYEALMAQGETLQPLRSARDEALAAVQALTAMIKQTRGRVHVRQYPGSTADATALAAAKATLAQTKDTLRLAESAYRTHIRPQLTALLETLWQTVHDAGQASPLPWYNERQVTDAFRNCVERFLKHLGGPPQLKRALTSAHLTYHFTGPPLTWEQLLRGKSSMITFGDRREVMPVESWVWDETQPQNARRRASRTEGHLRITDTDTLTFGVTLQRRPPEGALVKGVELVGRERSRGWQAHLPLWEWQFYVLCEIPPQALVSQGDATPDLEPIIASARVQPGDAAPAPILRHAALDLNWRIVDDDRIRVGMVWDGAQATPLYFPAPLVKKWRYMQDLQNDLAALLERCKATLSTLWAATPLPPDIDPRGAGWVQTGQGGLLRLLRQVEALPASVASRHATLAVLEPWARRTGKLWREWRGVSNRLDRAKAAWYCVTAQALCAQYGALALEQLDLKHMAEAPDQPARLAQSQKYRQLIGLGALVLRLTHTAQREGVRLVKVDPRNTSRTCPQCGTVLSPEQWDWQAAEQFIDCPHGCRYDVDVGAAQILYARAFGTSPDAQAAD